jgi:PmbA protein
MEHLLEILRSAQKVAEQAEVFSVSSQEIHACFEANKLKQVRSRERSSTALRIVRKGRIGFAVTSGAADVENLVDMAVETAQFGFPANFEFPCPTTYPKVDVYDSETEEIAIDSMVDLGNQLIAMIRRNTSDVLCDAEVVKGVGSVHIANSWGGETSYDKSLFHVDVEGVVIRDTDMLSVGDSESSCNPILNVEILASRVIRQLELAKARATVSPGSLPVIFTPRGVESVFLVPLAVAFNGKMVSEGISPLKDKLGKAVFDERICLWDDATLPYQIASGPCDDEGVPSQELALISNGVVSNFLYDLKTAALANTRSTGSGRRIGNGLPRPGMSSLIIGEGDISFQDMVESMKEGLVVEQVMGADQGNLLSGDFGANVLLGYKVENGEIVGRVKDTMIAGNTYQVLGRLLGIGREARWVGGTLRTPCLYCPSLSVVVKGL